MLSLNVQVGIEPTDKYIVVSHILSTTYLHKDK